MHTWMHDHLGNRFYEFGSAWLPVPWFAAGVSWLVMLIEFVLLVLLLVKRWNSWAVWGILIVHLGFLAVVGPGPFGYFTEALLISLLGFLAWPRGMQELRLRPGVARWVSPMFRLVNWDQQFQFGAALLTSGPWLELRAGEDRYANLPGLIRFLKVNPAFYVAVFATYMIALWVF